jgi:hypothetical protein
VSLFKVIAAGRQTDLHNAVGREVCTNKQRRRQAFRPPPTSTPPKSERLADLVLGTPDLLQNAPHRLAATARFSTSYATCGTVTSEGQPGLWLAGEAEDGERMNHVGHNHMANMDCYACVHCQHSTLLAYSHGFHAGGHWEKHVIDSFNVNSSHDQA